MRQHPVKLTVTFDPDALLSSVASRRAAAAARVPAQITRQTRGLRGESAALVFVWGRAAVVGRGLAVATAVRRRVPAANPRLFARALTRPYWSGGPEGSAQLEMYVFS